MSKWGRKKEWTKDAIILAITLFHRNYDYWPETIHFDNCVDSELPCTTTVQREFGTLAEARRQAGMLGGGHEGHGGSGRGGGLTKQGE